MFDIQHHVIDIPDIDKPRVVIIGGGFAGVQLAKGLKGKGFQVVMLDRHNYHTFQPLLYQVATAGLEPDSIAEPLRKLLENYKDFYFRMASVQKIRHQDNVVETVVGDLRYDYLVVACGSKTNFFGHEDHFTKAFPLKQVPQALDLRSHMLQNFEKAVMTKDRQEHQSLLNMVIVGGGPTGVEVAGALGELKKHVLPKDYPDLNLKRMGIYLIEGQNNLLGGMSEGAGQKAYEYLQRFEVSIILERMVQEFDGKVVRLNDGTEIPSQTLVWAAGVTGNIIDGLAPESVQGGRIQVDTYNRVEGHENVFAIGDIAMMQSEQFPKGHPMLAPVAMQQGKLLAQNLVRLGKERSMKPFEYLDKGSMATVGRNRAVVDLPKGIRFGGLMAWLVWMFVHLLSIIGFRNKLVVFSNWIWNYFTYDRGTRLIIRPFVPQSKPAKEEMVVKA